MKKVAEVVELYRKLARIPQPTWARISKSPGSHAVVNSVWTHRDLERADKVQFAKTYCVKKTSEAKFEVTFTSRPQELANEQWNVESPSGNLRAIVRKITNKKNEEKQFVEIWNGSQKLQNIDVLSLEKHGKIYDNDGYFGSVEWSRSEGHLLCVAELKYPKAVSFFDKKNSDENEDETKKDETKEKGVKGEEYVVKEEWGEGMVGKHHPAICILDVDTGDIRILDNVPDHVSPGHVVWAPYDSGVVFTGWCHEPYRLGVIYCINRQSAVYYLDLQKATCEALTDPNGAARFPAFSPDDSSFVFLQSNRKGPHYHCSRLCKYDWQKKEATVVCDVVGTPKDKGFPGVYAINIPRDCWSTDNKRIVIDSLWRSQAVLQQAIQTYDANYVLDTSEGTCDVVEVDAAELDTPALATSPQSQPQERKRSVKVQAKIDPIRRTRRIQVRVASKSIGIQCELLKPTCDSDNETELDSEDNNDPEIYNDSEYEPDTDDELDDERDSDGSGDFDDDMPMNYRLDKDAKPEDQHQFLVSESALAELMSTCRSCCLPAQTFVKFSRGTMIATNSVCVSGHISEWRSQPCDGRMPWSNLFTAGAIFFSGINCAKALHLFEGMNLQTFSKRTFTTLQTSYIVPAVEVVWEKHQASLIQERAGKQIICGGDARCDSPGFSAKYGAYTLMDLEAKKVLDMQLVQV